MQVDFTNKQNTRYEGYATVKTEGPGAYSDGTPRGASVVLGLTGESNQNFQQGRRSGVQALSPAEARALAQVLLAAADQAEKLAVTA
jgi:hypothetical protein